MSSYNSHNADDLLILINKSGLRQDFIAEKFGISPNYLSLILHGKRKAKKLREEILLFVENFTNSKLREIYPVVKESLIVDGEMDLKNKTIISQAQELRELKEEIKKLKEKISKLEKESDQLSEEVTKKSESRSEKSNPKRRKQTPKVV